MAKKWFVLRVQSNKEDKVKGDLEKRIKMQGIEGLIPQILVPSEKVSEIKGGKKRVAERKMYPGYVMAEIEVDEKGEIPENVWYMIRDVPGAGDLIGGDTRPIAMESSEVERLLKEAERAEEKPKAKIEFHIGDRVRVKEGPFENYEGVVEEVLPTSGCLKLMLTIFGRPTPVELEYWQVEAL
ncbi:transcription antiterminator NusG [Candidatus Scalindua japonica]|uniref:Transcription termination/antitermination protein NusG n=1 Tax=Candidatus Scalindua japonica TaxID=1284222 RepID=A0A286U291_9BACT|nr:transcription termination/antitermination protein NusG [Candidatus Scalindua japonica]GAX62246.1 transcription antiterminator NusG [Candidatus Scalindua japonica]